MLRTPAQIVTSLLCAISLISGCTNPMAKSTGGFETALQEKREPDSVDLVSSSRPKAMTFLDSESLQHGTGRLDDDPTNRFEVTPSGLRYRVLRHSDKPKPTVNSSVKVNYRGWLDNGKEFDSSYDSEPASFPLKGVIAGWTEGMQLVGEGGMIELWVPPSLGYGKQGSPPTVPPNATLHFIVELIDVN